MKTKKDNPMWLKGYEAGHGDAMMEQGIALQKAVTEVGNGPVSYDPQIGDVRGVLLALLLALGYDRGYALTVLSSRP